MERARRLRSRSWRACGRSGKLRATLLSTVLAITNPEKILEVMARVLPKEVAASVEDTQAVFAAIEKDLRALMAGPWTANRPLQCVALTIGLGRPCTSSAHASLSRRSGRSIRTAKIAASSANQAATQIRRADMACLLPSKLESSRRSCGDFGSRPCVAAPAAWWRSIDSPLQLSSIYSYCRQLICSRGEFANEYGHPITALTI